jgi:glutamyl-tRNA synthetase
MPKNFKPIVTRFPPEPSGYPHAGHLKAIYTNLNTAIKSKGSTILRFDDTNPTNSKQEYVDSIISALKTYGLLTRFKNGDNPSYASDYFDIMLTSMETLIKNGDAYVDESPSDEISKQRNQLTPSPFRDVSVEENIIKWHKFMNGELPMCVIRFKISYNSPNSALRDPIAYRYNSDSHFRTGNKYCIYPTYDMACPIADSLDGVTLAQRTNEFTDKNDLMKWVFKKLPNFKSVTYKSYSRFVLEYSLLSKRKIRELIEKKVIDSWDDPRLDTLSAEIRKGILPSSWDTYFTSHGTTNSNGIEEWDKLLNINRKTIDTISMRVRALSSNIWKLIITDLPNEEKNIKKNVPWSPKDKKGILGNKEINISDIIAIDDADAKLIKEGELLYLLNFRVLTATKIDIDKKIIYTNCYNKEFHFKDIPWKISWLTFEETITIPTVKTTYYDYILTKPSINKDDNVDNFINSNSKKEHILYLSNNISYLKKGMIIQLVRFGFYIVDSDSPLNLVYIREPGNKVQYLLDSVS